MRSTAINDAVNKALENEQVPYAQEVTKVTEALILEERNKTAELIRTLQLDLERKVNTIKEDANKAIEDHRVKVVEAATETAKADYDNFILGVSKLIDKTNID